MSLAAQRKQQSRGNNRAGSDGESGDRMETATLIFNPHAGGGVVAPEEIVELLDEAGFRTQYIPTEQPEDLDEVLRHASGLVVSAGGDGTLREVAKRLRDAPNPLTVIPLGTANNTARTLGVEGSPQQLIPGLRSPDRVFLDLIQARGPWGAEVALEGAGLGLFANVLAAYHPDQGKSMLRALGAAANTFDSGAGARCRVELDGKRLDGEYFLVEAMNMQAIGPRLMLAPDADPTDGLLDVVLVRHEGREPMFTYLRRLMTNALAASPSVTVQRGSSLKVNWRNSAFHVDGLSLCDDAREAQTKGFSAQIDVIPAALEMWLPGKERRE